MSEPRRHHYHAQSILKQWSTPEANRLLERPFEKVNVGLERYGLLVVFDLRTGRVTGRKANETCMVDDLYTLAEMSAQARGLHRHHTNGHSDQLRDPSLGPSLASRMAKLGEDPIPLSDRRRTFEVGLYGEIDAKAAVAFGVLRSGDEPALEHLLAVHKYLRSQLCRTPWAMAAMEAQMPALHEKLGASFPVDPVRYAAELEAIIEHADATVPFEVQRLGPARGYDVHIELLVPGWGAPRFVFGDDAGRPWRSVTARGTSVHVQFDGPPVHMTYPISPERCVRMTVSERDDENDDVINFTFERRVVPLREVQRINTALAHMSRNLVVLPSMDSGGLFLPGVRLGRRSSTAECTHD